MVRWRERESVEGATAVKSLKKKRRVNGEGGTWKDSSVLHIKRATATAELLSK
jgi:hypothetical protein